MDEQLPAVEVNAAADAEAPSAPTDEQPPAVEAEAAEAESPTEAVESEEEEEERRSPPELLEVQGSELEVGAARGTYKLFSNQAVLVNFMPFWKQQGGEHWLFSSKGGNWRLSRELRVHREGSLVDRFTGTQWVTGDEAAGTQWCSSAHGGKLPQEARRWRRFSPDGRGSRLLGSLNVVEKPRQAEEAPSATAAEGAAFVSSMQSSGMRNWVLYKGQVINLEDPSDAAALDEATFARLAEQACCEHGEGVQAARPPPVPLQPWEVEKLLAVASQVTSALLNGRYVKDFGEILVTQLGGWAGDRAWAQEEQQRLANLVEEDGAHSRDLLLRWVEDSLIQSLREVMKEFNRGQLAGASSSSASGFSSNTAPATSASSSSSSASASASAGVRAAAGNEDELALQAALRASLEDCLPPPSAARGRGEVEEEVLWAFEDSDDSGDEAWEDLGSEAEEERSEKGTSEGGTGGPELAPASEPALPPAAGACGHACDLPGGCCICVARAPRPGAVPGLVAWWRRHGLARPPVGAPAAGLRFLCATCATAAAGEEGERWPLPFGGALLLREGQAVEELVGPASSPHGAQATEASWEDASSSWVALDARTLGETGSEASWVLAQA